MKTETKELFVEYFSKIEIDEISDEVTNFDKILSQDFMNQLLKNNTIKNIKSDMVDLLKLSNDELEVFFNDIKDDSKKDLVVAYLNRIFIELSKKLDSIQQEGAEEVVVEGEESKQEEASNQGNDVEGSQQSQQSSTGETLNAGMPAETGSKGNTQQPLTVTQKAGDSILPGQGGSSGAEGDSKPQQPSTITPNAEGSNVVAEQPQDAQKEEVEEEKSEQEKSLNAQEPAMQEQQPVQEQQTLEPVNQNTAPTFGIKSEKKQLEELKNELLQTTSKTIREMRTKMGLCNLLNEQCEMLINQNTVLRQNFDNLKGEKESVVGIVKSMNALLNVVNDGTKEHNLAIVKQINDREPFTKMRVELYENEQVEQLSFESLINEFKQSNEQSMNELKRLDGATTNFDTLALAYEEKKKYLSSIK